MSHLKLAAKLTVTKIRLSSAVLPGKKIIIYLKQQSSSEVFLHFANVVDKCWQCKCVEFGIEPLSLQCVIHPHF